MTLEAEDLKVNPNGANLFFKLGARIASMISPNLLPNFPNF